MEGDLEKIGVSLGRRKRLLKSIASLGSTSLPSAEVAIHHITKWSLWRLAWHHPDCLSQKGRIPRHPKRPHHNRFRETRKVVSGKRSNFERRAYPCGFWG